MTLVDIIERAAGALIALTLWIATVGILLAFVFSSGQDPFTGALLVIIVAIVIPVACIIYIFRDRQYS